jgi:hypothetical protein
MLVKRSVSPISLLDSPFSREPLELAPDPTLHDEIKSKESRVYEKEYLNAGIRSPGNEILKLGLIQDHIIYHGLELHLHT